MSRYAANNPEAIRIEAENEWPWCGARRLDLAPRAFAVLRHLVEHQGRLITKEELLTTVWRDAIVSDAALASGIRDLRRALGDSSAAPRYIQTVHRRGFRFIGRWIADGDRLRGAATPARARPRSRPPPPPPRHRLRSRPWWADRPRWPACTRGWPVRSGTAAARVRDRRAGDWQDGPGRDVPGEIGGAKALRIGRGQCVEQYGAGEAYLPVLEALGRWGRAAGGERWSRCSAHAPTWLEQLPGVAQPPRRGGGEAPGAGGHAGPDAPRAGGGPGDPHSRRPPRAAARRPALE